jgi:negative regulator of flagellin synthesis FlgM
LSQCSQQRCNFKHDGYKGFLKPADKKNISSILLAARAAKKYQPLPARRRQRWRLTMSIDRTQRLHPVPAVQPRETPAENPLQPRKAAQTESTVSGTQVKLSDAQARLMQPGTQDIDMKRVDAIKQAIRNGELKMDAGKIADALLQDVQNDAQWMSNGSPTPEA